MAMCKPFPREKTGNLDLLPFMNLFSILIPFLLSVALFEKLGILDLQLPPAKEIADSIPPAPRPVVPSLALTVIITDDYLTIGAEGGFLPYLYYNEEVRYRSKSDGHVFSVPYRKGQQAVSPTDGKVMTPREKEAVFLHFLEKADSLDPGTTMLVAANSAGEPLTDSAGAWYTRLPAPGEKYQVIGDTALSVMISGHLRSFTMKKLSVYDEAARSLWQIHESIKQRELKPEDAEELQILASDKVVYDKIIHVMDAAKYAGFSRISLSLLEG